MDGDRNDGGKLRPTWTLGLTTFQKVLDIGTGTGIWAMYAQIGPLLLVT